MDCSPCGWKELNTTGHLSAARHSTTWVKTKNPSQETTRGWKLEAQWPWLLPLFESKNVSRGQKLKAGTKFIILDTAQRMGGHTGKLCLSNSEAGQRSTLQGKGVGIFSNEEERSQTVGRPHTQEQGLPGQGGVRYRGAMNRSYKPSGALFTFGRLSCFFLHT